MIDIKNNVEPDNLEKWFIKNPDKVYRRSVETAEMLVNNKDSEQEILFEFYWNGSVYAQIYMNKKDVPKAMEKAINFFVEGEIYELAQEAKILKDKFNNKGENE